MAGPLLASLARSTVISCTRQAVLAMRISLPPSPSNYLAASRQFKTNSMLLMEYDKRLYEAAVYEENKKYYIDLKQGDNNKYVKISEKSEKNKTTTMVDSRYLHMFTSKLVEAESGKMVSTLQAGRKCYDFHQETSEHESGVVITDTDSARKKQYRLFISEESFKEIVNKLNYINKEFIEDEGAVSLPPSSNNYPASSSRQVNTSSSRPVEYDKNLYKSAVYEENMKHKNSNKKYYIDLKQGTNKYVKISEKSRGKIATTMVDLQYLQMFTSKLMEADSGETVSSLQAENKTYDFRQEISEYGARVVVTDTDGASAKPYRVHISEESIKDIIRKLNDINDKFGKQE